VWPSTLSIFSSFEWCPSKNKSSL